VIPLEEQNSEGTPEAIKRTELIQHLVAFSGREDTSVGLVNVLMSRVLAKLYNYPTSPEWANSEELVGFQRVPPEKVVGKFYLLGVLWSSRKRICCSPDSQ
jgi:hypothetical protein